MLDRMLEAVAVLTHVPPANYTSPGAVSVTGQDTTGFQGEVIALLNLGIMGSSASVDAKLQECDALTGTYLDIAGAAIVTITGPSSNAGPATLSARLGRRANRMKYVRCLVTIGGTTGVRLSVQLLLTGAEKQPVPNVPASVIA